MRPLRVGDGLATVLCLDNLQAAQHLLQIHQDLRAEARVVFNQVALATQREIARRHSRPEGDLCPVHLNICPCVCPFAICGSYVGMMQHACVTNDPWLPYVVHLSLAIVR